MIQSPVRVVSAVSFTPVASDVTVTVALGITAPLGSTTLHTPHFPCAARRCCLRHC
jgi:hypothetical protein